MHLLYFCCNLAQNARRHENRKERNNFLLNNNHWNLTQDNIDVDDNVKNMPFISKVKWSVTYFTFKCCTFFFSHDLWLSYFYFVLNAWRVPYHSKIIGENYSICKVSSPRHWKPLFCHAIYISRTRCTIYILPLCKLDYHNLYL